MLGWFYWDPPREAFTIPFIQHSVMWYGVLFVAGFILAYFIINPILARFLIQIRFLSRWDVKDWSKLVESLRLSSSTTITQIKNHLDSLTRQQLEQVPPPLLASPLQQNLLAGLNSFLQSSSISRDQLNIELNHSLASPKETAYLLTDRLCWFVMLGTIIGARLGLVFFYDWPYFSQHPLEILKIWQGGLASHGGVLGVMLALYLYTKMIQQEIPQLSFLRLLDYVAIPSALVACFIRLGNFMNQEIVGTPSNLPWSVLFGHPAEQVATVPRHPVQLYEAFAYLGVFCILWKLWKSHRFDHRPGAFIGLLFIFSFSSRFILEFWKTTQESMIDSSFLQMGQLLSIPFILLGCFFFLRTLPKFCFNKRNGLRE